MPFPPSFYLILTIVLCCLPFSCRGNNNETDRLALIEIKARMTDDPLGIMSSWNDSLHFCEWHGITCGRRHPRVIKIHLVSSKLTGNLSPFVGNLSFLRGLYLYNNSINGIIPPEIGNLHRLRFLELQNNSLGGEIPPNISACSNLIELNVQNNILVGPIPVGIGSLLSLQYLLLNENKLTGSIPSSLGNLTFLYMLGIVGNNLTGTIPDSLGRLNKLILLSVSVNKLSGTVPSSIFNLSQLLTLDLGVNHLEGRLPLDFGNKLPNLQFFSIMENQFSGSIPASISNASNLVLLQLGPNNLQGQVPSLPNLVRLRNFGINDNFLGNGQVDSLNFVSSLANATMLDTFDISVNNLSGLFPNTICNFSMVTFIELGWNHIIGHIPTCIENLAFLQLLDLGNNQISGPIPSNIGKMKSLGILSLHDNQISGFIPSSIGNLSQLLFLGLTRNNLQGHIPSTLGNMRSLLSLDLSQNNLSGGIPSELFSLSSLSIVLYLSSNHLTGSLPTEVGQLKNLDKLGISDNMLSGEIPNSLGACTSLEYLYMDGNSFDGPIPPSLVGLKGLRELNLSRNNLSGKIPNFLASFQLQLLDLSNNHLEGELPVNGVFSNTTGLAISGNSGLCGGVPQLRLPPCKSSKIQKKRMRKNWRLIIEILSGFVVLLVAFISLCAFFHKRRRKEHVAESNESLPSFSYQALSKASNGFSSENLVGSGTFGVVYKGNLNLDDQTVVAIKVFNLGQKGALKTFMAECQVLRNVRHRNLVKVITACSSIDHQGKDFKALVFEYMENGSLEDWLHQKSTNGVDGPSNPHRSLNLLQRLDIAVDVAFALDYLHHHSGASIIHCDLKPSNVLFDDKMLARVGDFGLAKLLSNSITSSHGNQSSSIGVRGTVGYAPPEYGMGNEPSTYGDVYSFGVLMLEVLTGKRPTDNIFKEGLNLHNFVKAAFPDHVLEIVDQAVLEDIVGESKSTRDHSPVLRSRDHSKVILEALTAVIEIALSCSSELPQERLDMSDVATKLSSIRNNLLGTHLQRQRGTQGGGFN